ncbi:MAG: MarR family transcriptional regulator [Lachnospiraceae bacterium]|nr:MarR family transcriptional regulator [Lachnospiraceae bacterium]
MNKRRFEIAHRMKIIHNTFAWSGNRSLEKYGLTVTQIELMLYLLHNPDETIYQKEIERTFRLSNPTVTGILGRLEEKGMIVRQVDSRDHRYRVVVLSPKGRQVVQEMEGRLHETENEVFGCLTEEETDQLLALLDKVTANLSWRQGGSSVCGCTEADL